MSPTDPRHGTYAGYHQHVRRNHEPACQRCLDAAARYERGRQLDLLNGRPRATSTLATTRRIQALVALGYTYADLGELLGSPATSLGRLAKRRTPGWMTVTFADQIEALYDRLSMRLPVTNTRQRQHRASYARTVARRNRWAPPLAWEGFDLNDPTAKPFSTYEHRGPSHDDVDPVLVERVLGGDLSVAPDATTAERRLIVAAWTQRTGRPLRALEREAGWKPERYKTPHTSPTTLTSKEHTAA